MSDKNYLHIKNHEKLNEMDNDIHLTYSLDDRYIFIVRWRGEEYDGKYVVHLMRNGEDGCWSLEIENDRTKVVKNISKRDIQSLSSFVFWLNSIVREWVIEDKKNNLIMMAHNHYGVQYNTRSSSLDV